MNDSLRGGRSVSVHQAALKGYLVSLVGAMLVVDNALSVLTAGVSLTASGGVVLGLFGIGGGALGYFRPERFPDGDKPASAFLYGIAGVASVAFALWILAVAL